MKAKASIIITTYSRSESLIKSIESCLSQDIDGVEIVVVDDNGLGSDQQKNNRELLARYTGNGQFVYLPLEVNSGACIARNKGAMASSGEYLFFLDDDDEFLSSKVRIQSGFLDQHQDVHAQICSMIRMEDGKEIQSKSNFASGGDFRDFVLDGNFFTPMLAIRRQAFLESGGFRNIPRFQDQFFMMHFLSQGYVLAASDEPLYVMNEHRGLRITGTSVRKTSESIAAIKAFLSGFNERFSASEQKSIGLKYDKIMAATLYNSAGRQNILSSVPHWWRAFLKSGKPTFALMMAKAAIRAIRG